MPTYLRPCLAAARPVVPEPENGSRTVPPGLHPARTHRSGMAGGNTAKWASGKPTVLTDHTSPGFLPSSFRWDVVGAPESLRPEPGLLLGPLPRRRSHV